MNFYWQDALRDSIIEQKFDKVKKFFVNSKSFCWKHKNEQFKKNIFIAKTDRLLSYLLWYNTEEIEQTF